MDKLEVGTDNIYFEMESKQGTEARTYDGGNGNSKIPVTNRENTETSAIEAQRKGQHCCRSCCFPDRCCHLGFSFNNDAVSKQLNCFKMFN